MSRRNWLFVALIILSCTTSTAAELGSATLVVNVTGMEDESGQVIAHLFSEGGDVMQVKTALRRAVAPIKGRSAKLSFSGLPHGDYAVVVFQDRNNNNDMDHNLFRFPSEPLGFSNGFRMGIISGLPSFSKLQIGVYDRSAFTEIVLH